MDTAIRSGTEGLTTSMTAEHTYTVEISWTGNRGTGTSNYRTYTCVLSTEWSSPPTWIARSAQ